MSDKEERLRQRVKKLESRLEKLEDSKDDAISSEQPKHTEKSEFSRRSFLKMAGMGVLGAGAATMFNGNSNNSLTGMASAPCGIGAGSGGFVAASGEVQSTIDEASTSKKWGNGVYSKVTLKTGEVYKPNGTWELKRGVLLDFNGAKVVPSGNHDIIHMHPETRLIRPFIDVRGTSFDASAIVLDTKYGKYGGPNRAAIEDAHLLADPRQGTAIKLHESTGDNIGYTYASGFTQGFDTGILLRASANSSSWVNSNHFKMALSSYITCVKHRGVSGAAVNGNYFDLIAQPYKQTSKFLWDLGGEASFNTMIADVWDKQKYTNGKFIKFNGGGENTLIDRFGYTSSGDAQGKVGANQVRTW